MDVDWQRFLVYTGVVIAIYYAAVVVFATAPPAAEPAVSRFRRDRLRDARGARVDLAMSGGPV
jgi:hypothetical protein